MPQMRHESIGAAQKKVHLGLYAACFKDCSYTTELSHPQVDINGIISLLSGFFNPIPYYLQDCMK